MQKSIRYIDIHGHINFDDYDADREAVIARAADAGVGMVAVGTDLETSRRAIELAEKYENIWACVGIHPTEVVESTESKVESEGEATLRSEGDLIARRSLASETDISVYEDLRRLALHPRVVAIGECGLDYFHAEEKDFPAQIEAFERHIIIANEVKKPL
ncbi:MAG: TatD family hydrolase, partial [Patescibacteria group bacterium]|nr:TatD family hydrolase [Patescibacteria group bacterium]